jgi:hypothetical protein
MIVGVVEGRMGPKLLVQVDWRKHGARARPPTPAAAEARPGEPYAASHRGEDREPETTR